MQQQTDPLYKLQNGSDVRGVALQVPGGAPVTLTPGGAAKIAAGFTGWLAARLGVPAGTLRIGVGHDSRLTAASLKKAALNGIAGAGATAYDCGLATTPSMFMATLYAETAFDGAIMLTASHLPKERNGMKFFTKDGGLDHDDITALLDGAVAADAKTDGGTFESVGLLALYANSQRAMIQEALGGGETPLAGLHIVVDAGNGAGGFFATDVLAPLGADTTGSVFLEPDGEFPNHIPNPEDKAAMASIQKAVLGAKADLGIIFDTDVDRMSAVLPDGGEVNRNAIIAMMAAILAPAYPGGTIVTDSVTSDHLSTFLQSLGLVHHRFKRGYRNVINEAVRLNAEGTTAPLAIETSGHGAMQENYFLDDGAYMAVKLVIALAKARQKGEVLGDLIKDLRHPLEADERRINILAEDYGVYGDEVLAAFAKRAEEKGITLDTSHEGIRLKFNGLQGWMLLRKSLHDPLMPLNIESDLPGGCEKILAEGRALLAGFDKLDLQALA